MERIDILEQNSTAIALLSAISNDKDLFKKMEVSRGRVDVVLTMNGHEISFQKAIERVTEYREETINRRVAEKLESLMLGAGLKSIFDDLDSIKWQIRDKIEKMMGEKIEWSDY